MSKQQVRTTREQLAQLIETYTGSHFFSVKFIKKTTGEVRDMTCRKGVHKYTTGGQLKYVPSDKGLVSVWDAQVEDPAKAYRMISLNGLLGAVIDGTEYLVE